jgi:CheY-like chemotaxis protein
MTTGVDHTHDAEHSTAAAPASRRVLVAAAPTPPWQDVVRTLQSAGTRCTWVRDTDTPESIAADLSHGHTVLLVDLTPDPIRGMTLLTTCRRQARPMPVVVVAANPSIELARRIRLSGAFYLALDPADPDEMCAVVNDAFECLSRNRAGSSQYRVKPRVLVVDDDLDFVTSITTLLEAEGYAVSQARSGRDALEKIRSEPPDLVVLDIIMEYDSSGYEVTEALKLGRAFEPYHRIPILMVSSIEIDPATRFRMASEVELITPDGYLTKPLDIPKFLRAVRELLGDTALVAT